MNPMGKQITNEMQHHELLKNSVQQLVRLNENGTKSFSVQQLVALSHEISVQQPVGQIALTRSGRI
jgi:hypothetical protein